MNAPAAAAEKSAGGDSPRKGPWFHRFLIQLCSLLLFILVYSLLRFVLDDIGAMEGPRLEAVETQHLDQAVVEKQSGLKEDAGQVKREAEEARGRRSALQDEVKNIDKTIDQLLTFQRLAIEKGVSFPESELQILQTNRFTFFEKQREIQDLTVTITRLDGQERDLRSQVDGEDRILSEQRRVARSEYNQLLKRHNLMVAGLKLLVLLPLSLAVTWLLIKKRKGVYSPVVYSSAIAVFLKLGQVIHQHFPKPYFKYIAIGVALLIVLKALLYLLKQMVAPKRDWLLKQYREAYEKFLCPICAYPIRRGPRRHLFWTARTVKKVMVKPAAGDDKELPYTCPACATALFESCSHCGAVRPSLLPACDRCGAQTEVVRGD